MPATAVSRRTCLGATFERMLYRTRILVPGDQVTRLIDQVLMPELLPGDIILLSSRAVAACQGRLLPLESSRPRWPAKVLANRWDRLTTDAPLAHPVAMQAAVDVDGALALTWATAAEAWRRWTSRQSARPLSGPKGLVRIGGDRDLSVYQGQLILPPRAPQQLANTLWKNTGYRTAIISVRLPGQVQIAGLSPGLSAAYISLLVLDNPLGSNAQQTPIAILRKCNHPTQA